MSIDWMLYLQAPFVWRAVAAGVLLAMVCAPLGCLVVWRRMAYVGDALAHSSLLGVALGVWLGVGSLWGALVVCVLFGAVLSLPLPKLISRDTLLGVLAHAVLAAGVVATSLDAALYAQVQAVLFGDVLAVVPVHLALLAVLAVLVAGLGWKARHAVLQWCLQPDVAQVEGVPVARVALGVQLLLCVVIAVAVHVVGVLMATAFLVLPAATARFHARTPEGMVLWAALVGTVAVMLGMAASLLWDIPSGAAMVLAAAMMCVASMGMRRVA